MRPAPLSSLMGVDEGKGAGGSRWPSSRSPDGASTEGVRAAAGMAIGRALVLGTAVATAILVPRFMGPEKYGAFASIMALIAVFMLVSEGGFGWVEMRLLAPAWRAGRVDESCGLASTTWTLRMLMSALSGLGVILVLELSGGFGMLPAWVAVVGLAGAGRFVATANGQLLVALGRRRLYIAIELGRAVAGLLAVLVGFRLTGLEGAFLGLLLVAVFASLLSYRILQGVIPFAPGLLSGSLVRAHRRFMLWSALGQILGGLQFWLPLYLVGVYRAGSQAGFLAIAVQILGVVNAVASSARMGLMPILSELVTAGQRTQLRRWGSLILRLGSVINCVVVLLWLGIGRELIDLVWSPTYRPVFGPIAVILVSHIFLFSGALFEALLNLHGRAAIASLNMLGFTIATLAGTGMVLAADSAWIALCVAGVQAAAAGLYAMTGYLTLGLKKGIWLPIGRAFLPPIALGAILFASGELPDPAPASVAIALGLFLLAVPLLAIVRISEVRQILGALTGKKARTGV